MQWLSGHYLESAFCQKLASEIKEAPRVLAIKSRPTPSTPKSEAQKNFEILGVQKMDSTASIKPAKKKIEKRVLTFAISGALSLLEAHREEIRHDLALVRTEEGWNVRLDAPNSLVSLLGFKDGDYIRFTQFQQLRQAATILNLWIDWNPSSNI